MKLMSSLSITKSCLNSAQWVYLPISETFQQHLPLKSPLSEEIISALCEQAHATTRIVYVSCDRLSKYFDSPVAAHCVVDAFMQLSRYLNVMNMAVKEKLENVSEEIEWNVDAEVQLFYAMHGHKPVGVNKYFQMVCILEKFRNSMANKDGITSKVIWDHLDTMYDLQALDDTENLPFPNDEKEFSLPPAEFASLMEEKRKNLELGITTANDGGMRKEVIMKKETIDKKEGSLKEFKNSPKKDIKDTPKEMKKEIKEVKEPKKIVNKDVKEVRRESKDTKEIIKKEIKRETKETPKEARKEIENSEQKSTKPRASVKEKREIRKEEDFEDVSLATLSARKERLKELADSKIEDSPKRGGKRSTRGSIKPDDAGSNKSASPVTTATPPPQKRRRT